MDSVSVAWEGIILGAILMFGAVAGFSRSLSLLGESREDRDEQQGISEAFDIMNAFFVRANYVHMTKLSTIFIGGAFIFSSSIPDLGVSMDMRLFTTPLVLLAVLFLIVFLGEMEARARRNANDKRREQTRRRREQSE